MNRIIIENGELNTDGSCVLTGRRAAHIAGVLHAVAGQSVRIGVVDGPRGTGELTEVGRNRVVIKCELDDSTYESPRIDLLLALPRPKVLKRLWAVLASFGVGRIMLTNAAKVEKNYFDTHWLEAESFRPLLIEGLEQSGRTALPKVSVHRRFRPLVEDELIAWKTKLVADPSAQVRLWEFSIPRKGNVLLAVGPEGGWTEFELELLCDNGFMVFSLGSATFRSDVACIALLAVLSETM